MVSETKIGDSFMMLILLLMDEVRLIDQIKDWTKN